MLNVIFSRSDELTPEERDARTVFCMQLSQRIRARDLEEFFSSVGKVQDVRLITCNKTRRFKGIAYVEFKDPESVTLVSITLNKFFINLLKPLYKEKKRLKSNNHVIFTHNSNHFFVLYVSYA